jgi:hypothetical protein
MSSIIDPNFMSRYKRVRDRYDVREDNLGGFLLFWGVLISLRSFYRLGSLYYLSYIYIILFLSLSLCSIISSDSFFFELYIRYPFIHQTILSPFDLAKENHISQFNFITLPLLLCLLHYLRRGYFAFVCRVLVFA